jgi:phage tail-like protein
LVLSSDRPKIFSTFNFAVEITVEEMPTSGESGFICKAAFAECDGLELSMQPKTFQEGGLNTAQVHLAGPASYGQLTLKRGMSHDWGLWQWCNAVMKSEGRHLRGQVRVILLDTQSGPQEKRQPLMEFILTDCLPTKLRVPPLNAREGAIAIEEIQLVYSAMDVALPS